MKAWPSTSCPLSESITTIHLHSGVTTSAPTGTPFTGRLVGPKGSSYCFGHIDASNHVVNMIADLPREVSGDSSPCPQLWDVESSPSAGAVGGLSAVSRDGKLFATWEAPTLGGSGRTLLWRLPRRAQQLSAVPSPAAHITPALSLGTEGLELPRLPRTLPHVEGGLLQLWFEVDVLGKHSLMGRTVGTTVRWSLHMV